MATVKDTVETMLGVPGPIRLIVETGSGDIRITRGQDGQIVVRSHFVVRAPTPEQARKLAEAIKADPPIELAGQTVEIGDLSKYRSQLGLTERVRTSIVMSFDVEVPYQTEVELDSGSGDQVIEGIRGPVRADAGSGNVEITDIEQEVFVDTGSGNIAVTGASHVEADAGSGNVRLSKISGGVNVDVGSGNVFLSEISGDVWVETSSGNVRIDSALAEHAQWRLETSSGDVRLQLPAEAGFRLHAETSSGRIRVDFPLTISDQMGRRELHGTVGDQPSAEIRVETSSGNIEIRRKEEIK